MRGLSSLKDVYEIAIPYFNAEEVKNFNFNSKVNGNNFIFYFQYISDRWIGKAKMPDLTTRFFGVFPNVLNWSRFRDYSMSIISESLKIGLNDLVNCKIWIFEW